MNIGIDVKCDGWSDFNKPFIDRPVVILQHDLLDFPDVPILERE